MSEQHTGRDVVVLEPAGVSERGEEVVVREEFEVGDVDVLFQFTPGSANNTGVERP